MKQLLLLISAALLPLAAQAQRTFTEKLRQYEDGEGVVIVNQSKEIEDVVNGTAKPKANRPAEEKPAVRPAQTHAEDTDSTDKRSVRVVKRRISKDPATYTTRTRHKGRGYRICIFTGGNSRADKTKAIQMANKCRQRFPELSVYTSFVSPRWVTHVGDFKTRQEAQKYVARIRSAKFTYETRVVATEVNLPDY